MKKKYFKLLEISSAVIVGNLILAFLVAAFVAPNEIVIGGVTGLGFVLEKIFLIDAVSIIFILNILLLTAGGIVLGKTFFISTAASSLLYPLFLRWVQYIPGISSMTENKLLASIVGGCLLGIALGLVIRVGSSTGGMDSLNMMLHKWLHVPVSLLFYVTDAIVIFWQALYTNFENVLYGIVMLIIETLVLNQMMQLGQTQMQVFVVSSAYEKIRQKIIDKIDAGVTMIMIETGYSGVERKAVMCIVQPRKVFMLKELILSEDKWAFITIMQIREVHGRGFTAERKYIQG